MGSLCFLSVLSVWMLLIVVLLIHVAVVLEPLAISAVMVHALCGTLGAVIEPAVR